MLPFSFSKRSKQSEISTWMAKWFLRNLKMRELLILSASNGSSFLINQFSQYPMRSTESVWFSCVVCLKIYYKAILNCRNFDWFYLMVNILDVLVSNSFDIASTFAAIWNVWVFIKSIGWLILPTSSSFFKGNIQGSKRTPNLQWFT